jgi:hypothetical protein
MFIKVHLPIPAFRLLALTPLCGLLGVIFLVLIGATPAAAQTPSLQINDISVNEGDPGPNVSAASFTITLSAPSQQQVTVHAATQDGTAIGSPACDTDYCAGQADIVFNPGGPLSQTLTVLIKGDTLVEGTEQFFVNLTNPVGATISKAQGVCTIIDDDALLLLTEPNVQRGAALDSVTFVRDPFPITTTINFSSDQRTRITVLGTGLKLAAGEHESAVTATAEDSVGTIRPLTVEYVGKVPTTDWLWQVALKLTDQITPPQDIKVRITVHGVTSNFVLVGLK